jgi:hypothetical protein
MASPNSCFTIDRALFASRTLSWAESVRALFRDFRARVQNRKLRSRYEARLQALALAQQHEPKALSQPKQVDAGFEFENLQNLGPRVPLELAPHQRG